MRLHTSTLLLLLFGTIFVYSASATSVSNSTTTATTAKRKVLILGGGVAGVIAARTLHQRGIDDFVIIEAQPELGGRLASTTFGSTVKGREYVIEKGANWIQGTQEGTGPANPIYLLAKKHGIKSQFNDFS